MTIALTLRSKGTGGIGGFGRLCSACAVGAALALGAASAFAQQSDQASQNGPQPSTAQASPPSSNQLQEVVVTATKRSQNVQDVPISVQAFSNEELQEKNILNLQSLTALSPGVDLEGGSPFSGDRSVLSASIRGIGQNDFAFNLNPGVGVYVDGVFLARTIGANVDLLDVDQVQILKGAQGTLFGANTIGGAINIVTHTPGNTPSFTATATGGSYNERDVGFTADIPIVSDVLLSSITVSSQQQDGYQKVIPYPTNGAVGDAPYVVDAQDAYPKAGDTTGDAYGGTGVVAMRGKLLWKATDKLNITFEGDWTHEDQEALPNVVISSYVGNLGAALPGYPPAGFPALAPGVSPYGSTFSTLYDLCIANGVSGIAGAVAAVPGGAPVGTPTNNLFSSVCSQPRGRVPGISTGGAALIGAGYVGVPAGQVPFPGVNPAYNYNNLAAYGNIGCNLSNPHSYCGTNQPRIFFSSSTMQTGNYDTTYANGPDYARQDIFGFSLNGVYTLSDTMQLKSITAYRQDLWDIGTDLDGTPETLLEVTDQQHQWQISQEFQLIGKALDNRLNYVGGLYYFNEYGYVHDYVPFEGLLDIYDSDANDVQNTYYAAFVHLDYSLNDHWEFIAGERYTDAQTYFLGGQGDLNSFPYGSECWQTACSGSGITPFLPVPGFTPPYNEDPAFQAAAALGSSYYLYFPLTPDSQAWHVSTPTASIQYHFNDDVMAYATWGKGFKQGGWTTRLSALIPDPTAARFGPEYAKQWELGVKSEWLNHHLLVNADVFYTNYDGIQLNIQQGISPVYTNAGNAIIRGAEVEVQSLLPGGLHLNGSASYIDDYYTYVNSAANIPQYANPDGTTVCPVQAVLIGGATRPVCDYLWPGVSQLNAQLPYTPRWKFTFDPTYDYVLPNEAILRFIPVFTYTTPMFLDSLNTPGLERPVTREFDASIHYVSANGMYDVALGGTNLTDDRYFTAGSVNYGAGVDDGYINAPREWYLTVKLNFGK